MEIGTIIAILFVILVFIPISLKISGMPAADPNTRPSLIGGGIYMSRSKRRVVTFLIFAALVYALYRVEYVRVMNL
jgi:uncharacterized protein YqfA (UPF0365 family)